MFIKDFAENKLIFKLKLRLRERDLPSASHNTHIEDMIKSILNMLIDRL